MAKTRQPAPQDTGENLPVPSPTTAVSAEKPFDPTRSKEEAKVYADATEQNREFDFVRAILEARTPPAPPPYVPPAPPPAVQEQTRLEMEAGKKRVAEFEAQEATRREVHEAYKRDKWADKGSTPVFRPDDYIPDQKKGQGVIKATATDV